MAPVAYGNEIQRLNHIRSSGEVDGGSVAFYTENPDLSQLKLRNSTQGMHALMQTIFAVCFHQSFHPLFCRIRNFHGEQDRFQIVNDRSRIRDVPSREILLERRLTESRFVVRDQCSDEI